MDRFENLSLFTVELQNVRVVVSTPKCDVKWIDFEK